MNLHGEVRQGRSPSESSGWHKDVPTSANAYGSVAVTRSRLTNGKDPIQAFARESGRPADDGAKRATPNDAASQPRAGSDSGSSERAFAVPSRQRSFAFG